MKIPGLSRLDTYVAKTCIGSFIICFFFIMGLTIVFDLLLRIDSIVKHLHQIQTQHPELGFGYHTIVEFYLYLAPFIFMLVGPFITVTAGMFAVTRLMGSNEITPMLFCGRSVTRILVPVFVMGIFATGLMVGVREYVLPDLLTAKDNLWDAFNEGKVDRVENDIIIELPGGNSLVLDEFRPTKNEVEGMRLYMKAPDDYVQSRILASSATWIDQGNQGTGWYLVQGRRTDFTTKRGYPMEFLSTETMPGLHPDNLRKQLKDRRGLLDLSYSDLMRLVRAHPTVSAYTVYLHYHITYPLANLILLLLALPFALRFERGSKTERIFYAFVICGAYLATDSVTRNMGTGGYLHPVIAAWFPTVLFGSLGAVLYDSVRT